MGDDLRWVAAGAQVVRRLDVEPGGEPEQLVVGTAAGSLVTFMPLSHAQWELLRRAQDAVAVSFLHAFPGRRHNRGCCNRVEGNRRASRNGRVSSSRTRNPEHEIPNVTIRILHRPKQFYCCPRPAAQRLSISPVACR
jgi:hypothetical protein